MKVLGIDTIFHSTCAAVVEDGRRVLSSVVRQEPVSLNNLFHLTFSNLKEIGSVIGQALKQSNNRLQDISLISVSNSGSLFSSVLVGVTAANILSKLFDIPVIGVGHYEAHIFSNWLERNPKEFQYPILVLSSSGGHTNIVLIKNQFEYKEIIKIKEWNKEGEGKPNFLGIGSVYSFLSSNLGLGGETESGHLIARFSKNGNPRRFNFVPPRNRMIGDFDFSWLKREITKIIPNKKTKTKKQGIYSKELVSDVCASFEETVCRIIINDLLALSRKIRIKEIHLAGGISANDFLQKKLKKATEALDIQARCPIKKEYSIDNAAMIASLGYYRHKRALSRRSEQKSVKIKSDLRLEKIAISQYEKNSFY